MEANHSVTGSSRDALAPTDPRRGRRVGIAAGFTGILFVAIAVLFISGAGGVVALVLGGSVLAALGVLAIIIGGIGLSTTSRYPAVTHLRGPNDVARLLVLAAGGLGGAASAVLSPDAATGLGIVLPIVVASACTFACASAIRTVLYSPEVVSPTR